MIWSLNLKRERFNGTHCARKARESEIYSSGNLPELELTPEVLMMLGDLHLDESTQG